MARSDTFVCRTTTSNNLRRGTYASGIMRLWLLFPLTAVLVLCKVECAVTPKARERARNQKSLSRKEHSTTFVDLVKLAGYIVEEHDVTTEDGYILTVHRIKGPSKSPVKTKKPPVILIHGLFGASDIWVLRGPKLDLAYLLSDAGYDVWCLNVRGNYYGKRHKRLSVKEPKFWRFSWHEFGVYDLAAMIDYVISVTNVGKVSLIGHSMGSTVELVLLSMKPEYNKKVNVVLSFAPVAIFTHKLPGLVNSIGIRYGKQLQKTFQFFGMHEFMPRSSTNINLYNSLCAEYRIQDLCQQIVFFILGMANNDPFNTKFIPMLLNHFPQGTSMETLIHYQQITVSGKFRQYDFGSEINKLRYVNGTPPEYPLEKITAPVVLYYGMNDAYITEKDVLKLSSRLQNSTLLRIKEKKFSHLDFLFSNNTKTLLYDNVIATLNTHVF